MIGKQSITGAAPNAAASISLRGILRSAKSSLTPAIISARTLIDQTRYLELGQFPDLVHSSQKVDEAYVRIVKIT
jgi:hypothetical protein